MNTNNKSLSFTPKVKISILIIAINNEVQTEVDENWKNELDFSSIPIVFEETADSYSTENSQATNQPKIDNTSIDRKEIANKAVFEAKSSNINKTTPFGCGHCDANFSSFDSLKKHITGTYIFFLFQHFSFVLTISDSTVLAPVRSSLI